MEQILDGVLSSPHPICTPLPVTPGALLKTPCPSRNSLTYSGLSFVDEEAGNQGQEGACPRLPNDLENLHLQCSLL